MKEKISSIICQLWSVVGIISIFFISACYYARGEVASRAGVMTLGMTVAFAFLTIYRYICDRENMHIKLDWRLVVLLVVTIVPRVIQVNDIPFDDASIYYRYLSNGCKGFQFTWDSFQGFKLAAHPTLGYAGITAIGYFIYPNFLVGVNVVVLILECFTAIALYKIFQIILPQTAETRCLLYVILIMNIPVYLGMYSFYCTDTGIVIFMIFALYYLLQKKYVLTSFWTIMLLETKENALLVVATIAGIIILYYLVGKIRNIEDRRVKSKWIIGSIIGVGILLAVGLFFVLSWEWAGGLTQMFQERDGNRFGIEMEHIVITLKEIFLLNFNWLLWLLLIVLSIVSRFKNESTQIDKHHRILLIAIFYSIIVQILFFLAYLTVEAPRYHCYIVVGLCMLLCVLIEEVIQNNFCKSIITVSILSLLFIQSFMTIDPVMSKVFYRLETEGLPKYTVREEQDDGSAFYNYQHSSKARLFETILEESHYFGQDIFLVSTARLPFIYCEGYWNIETNSLSSVPLLTTVPIKSSSKRIVSKRKLVDKIPSERTTDAAIIMVQPYEYNNDRIVEQLMQLYDHIDYEAREVSDGKYGKMYYYLVSGSKNVE